MVPEIVGPREWADPIHEKLLQAAPTDGGRQTELISSKDVGQAGAQENKTGVALVSYNQNEESDLALTTAARQQQIDFILRGEILPDRYPRAISEAGDRLAVSWRLLPIGSEKQSEMGGRPTGWPVVVDLESAVERYPDLALAVDKESALQAALVRETLPLITPSVQREQVQLEIAYLLPGSQTIRRGNALALNGRWGEAEALWQQAREQNPFSSAAVHNLALAAVAKQDFSSARELARKAVRMNPSRMHKRTMVWVERTQRAYHTAFNLPDPPEGWSVTR